MNKIILPVFFLILLGVGCEQAKTPANIINETSAIVPLSEAAAAPDEPLKKGIAAMPCLQFTDNQGFLRWLDAYRLGENLDAISMAKSINLPEQPSTAFIEALKMSHPNDVIQTQICVIHKDLGLITWNSDFANTTNVYTYYDGGDAKISLDRPSGQDGAYCLPNKITDNEMIYKCGKGPGAWKQVHVNRKTGEMRAVLCETEKDGQAVDTWEGCLGN
ncbi:hypothetical protein KKG46_05840 [Patescibacteria group bacterium]|nr:hypothetical protein [Patescibacteria group bacterium]